jgi:hypothetical protein
MEFVMDFKCYRCSAWPCECKDGQTIIHGDCREVLPFLEPVDLVLNCEIAANRLRQEVLSFS